ncbi:MAG: hypothetical protein V4689_20850 [Verrucomicrobiota bacterium]
MTRRSITLIAASHLLVILLGVLLARQTAATGANNPASDDSLARKAPSGTSARDASRPPRAIRSSKKWNGSEFARAWKAMPDAKLTTGQRLEAQRELLRQWAAVDLAAAIDAALGEAWDTDGRDFGGNGPLLGIFSEAFAENPQESWDLIASKRFGIASGILRRVWIQAAGEKDPRILAARIGDLSWRDRQLALNVCEMNVYGSAQGGMRDPVFKILAGLPEDVVTTEQLLAFAASPEGTLEDPVAMREEILRLGSGDERLAKVKAMLFGLAIASKSPEEIAKEIQAMPAAIGEEVLWAAFKDGSNPETVLGTMDLLIDEGAWSKVEQAETVGQLQDIARNGGAESVADWALTMPVRKETTELFHRSVEMYLRDNMDAAREWMTAIPSGVWRDRAFAEYSQQALNAHNDPAASRWALDQIGDPAFKSEATSWRSQWEKRSGWKPN